MKKIVYIHQYFVTPNEPGGTRSYWIAQEMLRNGYDVTMITSSSKYKNDVEEILVDGIKVLYIKEAYDQGMSFLQRFKAFLSFMFKSSSLVLKEKDVDLVFATSTPLTIGVPALLMKWFRKVPFVFEVRDLWPEVPIQMGALKNPIVIKLATLLEKTIYKNAKHIIGLSPGMVDGVLKYVHEDKVSMVPNMSKIDEFWPRNIDTELMKSLGLSENTFKVIHFGALGLANGANTIIESAKLLKDNLEVQFLFVGGGSTERELLSECEKFGLINVVFLGKFPMKETSEIVNFSDVSIVSFKDLPILYTNSPNKLFDSLSAGKPIIVNSAGWTKELVESNECGYYVNPYNPQELVDKILYLQLNPSIVDDMGSRSRLLAVNKFDKSILTKQIVGILKTL